MRLSVVVGVVDGGAQLERCLAALRAQRGAPPLEIIVPWDDTVGGMEALAARYPSVAFPAIGRIATLEPPDHPAALHERYDRRKAAGLRLATGDLVALLEDRSVPAPGWAAAAVRAHAERPNVVIGGVLEDGRGSLVSRADYLCDFYRYQPPQAAGPRAYVSSANLCYKRAALERTRDLWQESYYDLSVHWALQREGEALWLEPAMAVRQERGDGAGLGAIARERLAWGRRFAGRRAREAGGGARLRFLLQAPLVPVVLYARALLAQRGGRVVLRCLAAGPAMLAIFGAWGLGELLGSAAALGRRPRVSDRRA